MSMRRVRDLCCGDKRVYRDIREDLNNTTWAVQRRALRLSG